jgi:O-antigen ligase/tetratricopeptide (TPR) repeat protein
MSNFLKKFEKWLMALVYLVVFVVFFLFFTLGDTYLKWFLLPMYNLGLLAIFVRFHHYYPKNIILIPVWMFFLIWTAVSSLFTHSIALTLDFFLFQITLFTSFATVVTVRLYLQKSFQKKVFFSENLESILALFFVIIGVVLSLISFTFLVNPQLAIKLPGFNILYASYGHNHLASLLILILPLSWWLALKKNSLMLIACTFLLTASLLVSFGRVAVTIGFVQVIFLFWLYLKSNYGKVLNLPKSHKSTLRWIFLFVLAIFVAVLAMKLYFSVITLIAPSAPKSWVCPLPSLKTKLCKPIESESRIDYWSQAGSAIKDYPLLGYGPGTYSLISKKYSNFFTSFSSYAHNSYLQMTAEVGLVGGFIFILMKTIIVVLVVAEVKNAKNKLFLLSILIGLVSLYLNNFFDFDWDFIGVATTATIMAGLAVSVSNELPKVNDLTRLGSKNKVRLHLELFFRVFNSKSGLKAQKLFILNVFFLLLLSSTVVIYAEVLFSQKKYSDLLSFFPFVSHHSLGLADHKSWSNQELDRLVAVFAHQPMFLKNILINNKSYPNWIETFTLFKKGQPGASLTDMLLPNWADQNLPLEDRIKVYEELLSQSQELALKHESFWYPVKIRLLENYLAMANKVYEQGDLEKSAEMYYQISLYDDWLLSNSNLAFLQFGTATAGTDKNQQDYIQSIVKLVEANPENLSFIRKAVSLFGNKLGFNQTVFGEVYLNLIQKQIDKCLEKSASCDFLIESSLETDFKNILMISPWQVGRLWETASIFYKSLLEQNSLLSRASLVENDVANQVESATNDSKLRLQQANKNLTNWFKIWELLNKLNQEEWTIGYPQSEDFTLLAQVEMLAFLDQYVSISDSKLEIKIDSEAEDDFRSIITKMKKIRPEDYAINSQLGHFYTMIGNFKTAREEYQLCLDYYQQQTQQTHYDCLAGLENLKSQEIVRDRFIKVGEVIVGSKTWDDLIGF